MEDLKNTPYWKRIWQITSGNVKNITSTELHSLLINLKPQILEGILEYQGVSESDIAVLKKHYKCTDEVDKFALRVSNYLNIHPTVAWDVLIYYVVFEFRGAIKNLQKLKYEMYALPMLDHVWRFYSMERMYKLKLLKHILEFMDSSRKHPFCQEYKALFDAIDPRDLWKLLLKQLNVLIKEIDPTKINKKVPLKQWAERNYREQVEIIHCLIMLTDKVQCNVTDFQELFKMFLSHRFGQEPPYYDSLKHIREDTQNKLKYAEVGLLLCIGNHIWSGIPVLSELDVSIENEIKDFKCYEELAAVVYVWIIIHMVLPNAEDLFNNTFSPLMHRVLSMEIFKFFYKLSDHEMFNLSSYVGVHVREALYNMLFITCNKFDRNGCVFAHSGVVELTQVLLRAPNLSERFLQDGSCGIMSLWQSAKEVFPGDYKSLSVMAEAIILSNPEHIPLVLEELRVLPVYTEIYNRDIISHTLRRQNSNSVCLLQPYFPASVPKFTVPVETECIFKTIREKTYIQFQTPFSFWFAVDSYIQVIHSKMRESEEMLDHIIPPLRVILAILQQDKRALLKYSFIKDILRNIVPLLTKYSQHDDCPCDFICLCIDLCTQLLIADRVTILNQLNSVKAFPWLVKTDGDNEQDTIQHGLVGSLICRRERITNPNKILISYIKLVKASSANNNGDFETIEYPALLFILQEVFPNFMSVLFRDDKSSHELLYECVSFMFEVFQLSSAKMKQPICVLMRMTTCRMLLNDSCGRSLLKLLCFGKQTYQYVMENETNWHSGVGLAYINNLQTMMSLLIQVLTLRKTLFEDQSGTFPMETLIYSDGDNLKIIRSIAGLLDNPFHEVIPTLACRLLKKFTLELKIPMLALLNLQSDQVRTMFLQRLRDPLENEELKVAIIELITAGIPRQCGMTEAFFRVQEFVTKHPLSPCKSVSTDTLGNFLVEYLIKTSTDSKNLRNPLLAGITELFHTLWMEHKEMLVKNLMSDPQFWPSLCHPLFNPICLEDKTYTEIFNIIGQEIYKNPNEVDESLQNILKDLFILKKGHLRRWIDYVFDRNIYDDTVYSNSIDNKRVTAPLIMAWKDFLIIVVKHLPKDFILQNMKIVIGTNCRLALRAHTMQLKDCCSITFLAELYLVLILNWESYSYENPELAFDDITAIMNKVALSYHHLPRRLQEAIVADTVSLFKFLPCSVIMYSNITKTLILSIEIIMEFEFNNFGNFVSKELWDTKKFEKKSHKSFIMMFALLNQLIKIYIAYPSRYNSHWFRNRQITPLLFKYVGQFIKYKYSLPLAKTILETLVFYAKSNDSEQFLNLDFEYMLWKNFLPRKEFIQPKYLGTVQELPTDLKNWWVIYKRLVILLTILLQKHTYRILNKLIMFVSIHEDYITEVLLLERASVDENVLDLVFTMLCFIRELLKYRSEWSQEHPTSMNSIINTLKMTLNSSAGVVLRPNILKYFSLNNQGEIMHLASESVPMNILIKIMNKLIKIIHISALCIMQCTPQLYSFLMENIDYTKSPMLIGMDFGLPKFTSDDNELNFGTLICVSCFLVRVLQQIQTSRKLVSPNPNKLNSDGETSEMRKMSYETIPAPDDDIFMLQNKISMDDLANKMSWRTITYVPSQKVSKMSWRTISDTPIGLMKPESNDPGKVASSMSVQSGPTESIYCGVKSTGMSDMSTESIYYSAEGSKHKFDKDFTTSNDVIMDALQPPEKLAVHRLGIYPENKEPENAFNIPEIPDDLDDLPDMDMLQKYIDEGPRAKPTVQVPEKIEQDPPPDSVTTEEPENILNVSFSDLDLRYKNSNFPDVGPSKSKSATEIRRSHLAKKRLMQVMLSDPELTGKPGEALKLDMLPSFSKEANRPSSPVKLKSSFEMLIRTHSYFSGVGENITVDRLDTMIAIPQCGTYFHTDPTDLKYMVPESEHKKVPPEPIIGFIRLDYLNPMCNLSAVQNFMSYAGAVTIFPWYAKMDEKMALKALESVVTLLSSQIGLALIHQDVEERDKHLIRRELCSELQIFHEFIKKRLVDKYRYNPADRNNLRRSKFGFIERHLILQNPSMFLEDEVESFFEDGKKFDECVLISEDYFQFLSNWIMYVLKTHDK